MRANICTYFKNADPLVSSAQNIDILSGSPRSGSSIDVLTKGGHAVIGCGNSVITVAKFGYRDRITETLKKLLKYQRSKGPSRLALGKQNYSNELPRPLAANFYRIPNYRYRD